MSVAANTSPSGATIVSGLRSYRRGRTTISGSGETTVIASSAGDTFFSWRRREAASAAIIPAKPEPTITICWAWYHLPVWIEEQLRERSDAHD